MNARVDAVAARVQTAVTTNKVTTSMEDVVKSMDSTLKSMNLEKISSLLDKFECQFETLDVQTAQMDDTMGNTTTLTMPQVEYGAAFRMSSYSDSPDYVTKSSDVNVYLQGEDDVRSIRDYELVPSYSLIKSSNHTPFASRWHY